MIWMIPGSSGCCQIVRKSGPGVFMKSSRRWQNDGFRWIGNLAIRRTIPESGIRPRFSGNRKPETGNRKPETVPLALRPEKDPEQEADKREQDQHHDPDEAHESADASLGGLDDGPDENDQPDQAE